LYVTQNDEAAPAHFRGIGIRIEDDVLVTGAEPVVLSAAVPKSIADVERACRDKSALSVLVLSVPASA
jgi:Xaa-Pro aminopeptidase